MGWFWPDPSPTASKDDPFHRLDPQVRDFLLRESPLKPTTGPSSSSSTSNPNSTLPSSPSSPTDASPADPTTSAQTPSKYGGRYADIWAQYTPSTAQESSKPPSEQLTDIVKAYKWRKGAIGRAALENCAEAQWALHECYRNGGFTARVTACGEESRRLNGCYVAQANFLKAMGYMSDFNRDPAVDERIQMEADRLYQEQVKQDEIAARKGEAFLSDPASSSSSSSDDKSL